jgi:anti-anti-sigma factor
VYQIESSATATTVRVRCEIDYASKLEFEAVLARASSLGSPQLIVSLEECPYLDCAGVSALVKIRKKARSPMSVILHESSYLWRLFSILGLKKAFKHYS